MFEQTDNLLKQLAYTLERFKQDTGNEPTLVIVSAEIFAKIMPALKDVRHDKYHSEGKFRSVTVKSDSRLERGNVICTIPPEREDTLSLPVMFPCVPPFATLHEKKREALKEKAKDFLRRRK